MIDELLGRNMENPIITTDGDNMYCLTIENLHEKVGQMHFDWGGDEFTVTIFYREDSDIVHAIYTFRDGDKYSKIGDSYNKMIDLTDEASEEMEDEYYFVNTEGAFHLNVKITRDKEDANTFIFKLTKKFFDDEIEKESIGQYKCDISTTFDEKIGSVQQ